MERRHSARIVNVSSGLSKLAQTDPGYASANTKLIGYSASQSSPQHAHRAARLPAPHFTAIKVNSADPGYIPPPTSTATEVRRPSRKEPPKPSALRDADDPWYLFRHQRHRPW